MLTKTLSGIPQNLTATHKLSRWEQRGEVATARTIVVEALAVGGFDPLIAGRIVLEANTRFSRRMGDARCTSRGVGLPAGVVRFSAHALWRRATPEKRRNTIVHELAHVLARHQDSREGHGALWKRIMRQLGETPKRCHSVNREGIRRTQGRRAGPRIVNREAQVYSFRTGQRVSFTHKGQTFVCNVVKRNRKTIEVREAGGLLRSWRVSPTLLALEA